MGEYIGKILNSFQVKNKYYIYIMWLRIINNKRYGYLTYLESCKDINRINIKFDGLFYIKL